MSTTPLPRPVDVRVLAASLAESFRPREEANDREGTFAAENVGELRDAGLLALNIPSSAGGIGADLVTTLDVLRTLAHGAPSTALMLGMHTSVLAHSLIDLDAIPAEERAAFDERRRWYWSEAVAGKIFAVANSEPGAAGDVRNSRARVTPGPDRTIDGVKSFASFGTHASYWMAAAWDETERLDYWVVRNAPDAVTVEAGWDALGMRSSESVVLRFTGAPVVDVLAYRGMIDGTNNRHWSTLSFAATLIGIAESLVDDMKGARGSLQRSDVVDLHLTTRAALGFLRDTASSAPAVPDRAYQRLVRDCKTWISRSLARSASTLFTAQSGAAYGRRSPVSRKLRDLLAGPALRPPASLAWDEIADELSGDAR